MSRDCPERAGGARVAPLGAHIVVLGSDGPAVASYGATVQQRVDADKAGM